MFTAGESKLSKSRNLSKKTAFNFQTCVSSYSSELESLWKLIAAKSLSSWVWKGCLEYTEIDEYEVISCKFTTWSQVERLQAFHLILPLFRNPLVRSRGVKRLEASTSSNLLFTSSETSRHAGAGQCLDRKSTEGELQTSLVHLHHRRLWMIQFFGGTLEKEVSYLCFIQ